MIGRILEAVGLTCLFTRSYLYSSYLNMINHSRFDPYDLKFADEIGILREVHRSIPNGDTQNISQQIGSSISTVTLDSFDHMRKIINGLFVSLSPVQIVFTSTDSNRCFHWLSLSQIFIFSFSLCWSRLWIVVDHSEFDQTRADLEKDSLNEFP